ncbi:MAG: FAD-dependent oxidoreductase [Gemmatimonadota bacterium]|nr:FAD-dependent oxidoreductase [Gemmatimonadota bacterium]
MTFRVAVVGAGLSGLVAARRLRAAGARATVFDKGRRPGGRANTREHGHRRYDHGAQYFTVREREVGEMRDTWLERGLVAEWKGRLVRLEGKTATEAKPSTRYVAVPGMIDLALHLAEGLDVQVGVRVGRVERIGTEWSLADVDGKRLGSYDRVVIATPAPQAVPLLEGAPALQHRAARMRMEPSWATMLSFDEVLPLQFDGAFVVDGPFSWIARDSSKPGRAQDEAWVVHMTPEWTRDYWDEPHDAIPDYVLGALIGRFGALPVPTFTRSHRWGYALASGDADGILYDPDLGIGACGDWCVGGRVEGALMSGLEIARRVIGD